MHRGPPTAKSPNLTVKTTITTVITAMTTTIPISATLANREAPPYTSCLSVANGKVCVWGGDRGNPLILAPLFGYSRDLLSATSVGCRCFKRLNS